MLIFCVVNQGGENLPLYEYECTGCSSRFELRKSFDDIDPISCPECGGDAQRVFSPVPIIFKGSGFYVTDSRVNHGAPSSEGNPEPTGAGSTEGSA